MRGFRHGLIFFLSLLATFALGDITESKNWLITSAERSLIRRAQESTTVPPPPYSRGIGVYARHYGGFAQIYIIGNERLSAERIAGVVDRWVKSSDLKANIIYSQEEKGPTVLLEFDRRSLGSRRSSTEIPVKSLVEVLRTLDRDVSAVWYFPDHVSTNLRGQANANIVDFSKAAPERLEGWTTVSLSQVLTFLAIVTCIPFLTLVGGLAAAWYARSTSIPLERRRSIYRRLFLAGFSVGLVGALGIGLFAELNGSLAAISDVWFAGAKSMPISMMAHFIGFAAAFLIGLRFLKLESRLLEPEQSINSSKPVSPLRTRDIFATVRLAPFFLGLSLLIFAWNLGTKSELLQPLRFLSMLLLCGGHFLGIRKPQLSSSTAADRTNTVANEIFSKLQVRPIPVRRVDAETVAVNCVVMAGQLTVTPAFEVDLNREEMKFLMTRALIIADSTRFPWQIYIPVLPVAIVSAVSVVFLASPWRFIVPVALLPIALIFPIVMLRRHLADRLDGGVSAVLRSTRNLAAARSALGKYYGSMQATHIPEEHRRMELTALEATAKELGLH